MALQYSVQKVKGSELTEVTIYGITENNSM